MVNEVKNIEAIESTGRIVVESIDYDNAYDFKKIHRHEYFEFILFKEGNGGTQLIDFEKYNIVSKGLYLIMPGQIHLMERLPEENGLLIQFNRLVLNQLIDSSKIDAIVRFFSAPKIELTTSQFDKLYALFNDLNTIYQGTSDLKAQKLQHLLGFILLEILELIPDEADARSFDNCAYRFTQAVQSNVKKNLTVKEFAQQINVPVNHLTDKVRLHHGKSPLQIIHRMRINEIKRFMMIEHLSHKEITYQMNFDSQSSYSRFIKKHTGMSPSELRESMMQIAH